MSSAIVVTGTDTGIGKTVFAAALAGALGGVYWKPVQAGIWTRPTRDVVLRLSGLAAGAHAAGSLSAADAGLAASRRGARRHHHRSRRAGAAATPTGRWSSKAPAGCWCR